MTIKRRLFWSNMLMLVLPIIFTSLLFLGAVFVFMSVMGIESLHELRNGHIPYEMSYDFAWQFDGNARIGIVFLALSVGIAVAVNRILTRQMAKRITAPIELLVSGVHEIRDGNLGFRISYDYDDEFKSVCDDFNEMAGRLHDMVTARQKDEESRRELIAGISHDLRTPLTSIKAYVEGLEKGVANTPQTQEKYLGTIKRKADDLERIINQLFLFSKLDVGEFPIKIERVEVNKMLGEFIEGAADEYTGRGLSLSLVPCPAEVYADVDVVQFHNVLHNVLVNSVKYKERERCNSTITCAGSAGHIIISIKDDGPGVAEENLGKLFDVFYRGDISRKDPGSGSGLGLAISRKIIERLGGAVSARNAPDEAGAGLVIDIKLPKASGGTA